MRCGVCGQQLEEGANFCSSCGAPVGAAADEHDTTVLLRPGEADDARAGVAVDLDDLAEDQALMVVKRGPNAGTKFVVASDRTTIGRHPESDFFLDDVTVSRRHAEVRREGVSFTVKDVGSLNGTYVNGERVEDAPLNEGDEMRVGKYVITFLRG